MRLGNIVIGFLLALALFYAHDAAVPARTADGEPQTIVNWEVFGRVVRDWGAWARDQIDQLIDGTGRRG